MMGTAYALHIFLFVCLAICFIASPSLSLPRSDQGADLWDNRPLTPEDREVLQRLPIARGSRYPGFYYIYVGQDGTVSKKRGPANSSIEIIGSPLTSRPAMRIAAKIVAGMVKHMTTDVFKKTAGSVRVGIFTFKERLTVFPEFSAMRNGNCGYSCSGPCARTCTSDGWKWENINGITGAGISAVSADNILCGPHDPHHGTENALTHELGHAIQDFVLTPNEKAQVSKAYAQARQLQTWILNSYAMSMETEYFATATCVFFNGNQGPFAQSGGMNMCTHNYCATETEARGNLRVFDNAVFQVLNVTFTAGHPNLHSGLSVCVQQ